MLLLFSHLNFEDKGCHDPCTDIERFCCPSHIMFTKPTRTNNKVIRTRDRYTLPWVPEVFSRVRGGALRVFGPHL